MVPSHKTFIRAIQKSNLNLIRNHLELMPDFLTLTFKSHSALSIAVSNNDLLVAKLLLDQGADVNVGVPGISRTPLHTAVSVSKQTPTVLSCLTRSCVLIGFTDSSRWQIC